MTEAQTALARRVVACKGWRWLPGTLRLRATPPSRRDYLLREGRVPDCGDPWVYEDWPVIPALTDAATLGCLLALVREAWPDEWTDYAVPVYNGFDGWTFGVIAGAFGPGKVTCVFTRGETWHPSEAEALVAALEAAP